MTYLMDWNGVRVETCIDFTINVTINANSAFVVFVKKKYDVKNQCKYDNMKTRASTNIRIYEFLILAIK